MEIRSIMSGQRKDPLAVLLRAICCLGSIAYRIVTQIRNSWFDTGKMEIHRVSVPVISIGNITVGGTGKTPMVAWLAKHLRKEGIRVSIVSRGYGAGETGVNDEAMELEARLPDVPHLQNPDRVEAARVVIEELATQLILLDDGFQHRRIHRDLDIVLIDATCPFGFDHLLPRGLLREKLSNLARADAVVLTRANTVSDEKKEEIRDKVRLHAPDALWTESHHRPAELLSFGNESLSLDKLQEKRVLTVCAIGNPDAFLSTVAETGAEVIASKNFPDHHRFTKEDVHELANWVSGHSIDFLVCTHKDLVKLQTDQIGGVPVVAISIDLEFLSGEQPLCSLVDEIKDLCPIDD